MGKKPAKSAAVKLPQVPIEDIRNLAILAAPQTHELGMEIVSLADREAVIKIGYRDDLVGNTDTGVLHGGVLTTLLDSTSGSAVFCSLPTLSAIATIDLRIDYLKPATPGKDLFALARCYKMTRHIAFVRAWAYHETREDAVATASSLFMIMASEKPS